MESGLWLFDFWGIKFLIKESQSFQNFGWAALDCNLTTLKKTFLFCQEVQCSFYSFEQFLFHVDLYIFVLKINTSFLFRASLIAKKASV